MGNVIIKLFNIRSTQIGVHIRSDLVLKRIHRLLDETQVSDMKKGLKRVVAYSNKENQRHCNPERAVQIRSFETVSFVQSDNVVAEELRLVKMQTYSLRSYAFITL